jgi:hypothetical protein
MAAISDWLFRSLRRTQCLYFAPFKKIFAIYFDIFGFLFFKIVVIMNRRKPSSTCVTLLYANPLIPLAVCLTTGPKPLPKPALHIV